jgi:glycosyltransferase involved in cell wall biosynthesis
MALGLPIISTNVGGIPFLVKDKEEGFLVKEKDYLAMSKAIEELLLNQNLWNPLLYSARNKAELFDWKIVKFRWFEILV